MFGSVYHIVWTTKYRYKVLRDKVAERLRELLKQGCSTLDITIIRGSVAREHVHMLISCPPTLAPSKIMQYLKGRSSKMLQEEFPEIKKRYWGQHLWSSGYFCRTVGAVTDEMIKEYIEQQMDKNIEDTFNLHFAYIFYQSLELKL